MLMLAYFSAASFASRRRASGEDVLPTPPMDARGERVFGERVFGDSAAGAGRISELGRESAAPASAAGVSAAGFPASFGFFCHQNAPEVPSAAATPSSLGLRAG
jgi:hypothetical protein